MGRDPEKLLTLEEASRQIGLPADDVEAMVRSGKLPAFRLGGSLLRIKLQDLQGLKRPAPDRRKTDPQGAKKDRLFDFFYFNDFYLVALLVILTLLALIFTL
ncbi:MAG: excisionase family DNA-binding protein [Candidatus Omnitrophica bacterium]|nr:excisionase family DNA-binding protein [Candidatus Omnitrophota bacterium]